MTENPNTEENLQERLHSAISEVLRQTYPEQDSLVSRWVLTVETVHDRGSTCSYIGSESLSTWEVLGMAEATSEMARAQLTYSYFAFDDEEDEQEE